MNKKYVLLAAVILTVGAAVIVGQKGWSAYQTYKIEEDRLAYEAFLAEHEYNNREHYGSYEAYKAVPKMERPDLAAERHFLRTLDPKLGYPPVQRLYDFQNNRKQVTSSRNVPGKHSRDAWVERGPNNIGGRTRGIAFDPRDPSGRKVWAGGVAGGLWFTDDISDPNEPWTKVNDFLDNLAITTIAFDPLDSETIYASTGEGYGANTTFVRGIGILKSVDGGLTWNHLESTDNPDFYYTLEVAVDRFGHVYAATRDEGLLKSEDGGETFTQVLGIGNGASRDAISGVKVNEDGSVYASQGLLGISGAVYFSQTGEVGTWERISDNSGFTNSAYDRVEIAVCESDPDVLYAMLANGNFVTDIYRTSNGGSSWSRASVPNNFGQQAWYDLSIAVDPNDCNTLVAGHLDLWKSVNGGSNWRNISGSMHVDQQKAYYRPGSSNDLLIANDGGVYFTEDATSTFPEIVDRNFTYNVTQFYAADQANEIGNETIIAGSQDNNTLLMNGDGASPAQAVIGGDGMFCFIDQDNPTWLIGSSQYGNYRYSKEGDFFRFIGGRGQSGGNSDGQFVDPSDYHDAENLLFSSKINDGNSYYVANIGDNTPRHEEISFSGGVGTQISAFKASPYTSSSPVTLFVGGSGGRVSKILNANQANNTVQSITNIPEIGNVSNIEIGDSEDVLIVTISNYGVNSVWLSLDGGQSWENKEGNLPDIPVHWAVFNPNNYDEVIIGTELGVWATDNIYEDEDDMNWYQSSVGLANTPVYMLQVRSVDSRVIAATHGRGAYTSLGFQDHNIEAAFELSAKTVCVGETVETENFSSNAIKLEWFYEDANLESFESPEPIEVRFLSGGLKTVRLTATSADGSVDVYEQTIDVIPDAITFSRDKSYVYLVEGDEITFTAADVETPGNSYVYNWDFGDGQSGTGKEVTHSYPNIGDYQVTLTVDVNDGQCSATETQTVTSSDEFLSINSKVFAAVQPKIYPTVTDDALTLEVQDAADLNYQIISTDGKMIRSSELTNKFTSVDVKGLTAGQYWVVLFKDGETWSSPFKKN